MVESPWSMASYEASHPEWESWWPADAPVQNHWYDDVWSEQSSLQGAAASADTSATDQSEEVAREMATLEVAELQPSRANRGSKDSHEDLNSLQGEWIPINLDSGASVSAFPASYFKGGGDGNGALHRTADGQLIEDKGADILRGRDENNVLQELGGRIADVHKILCSASKLATVGRHDMWLDHEGGSAWDRDSEFGRQLRLAFSALMAKYGETRFVPIYLEKGVYNFYLMSPTAVQPEEASVEPLASLEKESQKPGRTATTAATAGSSSGGYWRGARRL